MATKSLCQYNRYSLSLSSKFSSPITAFILIRCDHLFHLLRIITTDLVRIVQRRRTSDDTRRGGTWIPIFPSATGIQSIQSQQSIVPHDTSQRCWPAVRRPFPPPQCALESTFVTSTWRTKSRRYTQQGDLLYTYYHSLYIYHTPESFISLAIAFRIKSPTFIMVCFKAATSFVAAVAAFGVVSSA